MGRCLSLLIHDSVLLEGLALESVLHLESSVKRVKSIIAMVV